MIDEHFEKLTLSDARISLEQRTNLNTLAKFEFIDKTLEKFWFETFN